MKTLYVSDLDGTLLNSNTALTDTTIETINALVEEGMEFTFATARSITSASLVTRGLHLRIPLIVYNGVYLLDPDSHDILYSHSFTRQDAQDILNYLLRHDMIPFVYSYIDGRERVSYMEEGMHEGGKYYMESRPYDKRFRKVDTTEQLLEGDVFYFTCIHDGSFLKPMYEYLEETTDYVIVFQQELYREEYWLEVMPRGVSKAQAILELKEKGGYDRVISFGDAINDLPMFQISDECYAVGNAIEELKNTATAVIGDHDADAVAMWLKENYQKKAGGSASV